MFRAINIAIAAIVALTVAALPVMLDRCAESCDAHRSVATAPACHHAAAAGTRITHAPASCGHDHNGTAVTAAKSSIPTDRSFASLATPLSRFSLESPLRADVRVSPHSPPDAPPSLGGRTLPLRV